MKIKVAIADDHPMIVNGLKNTIATHEDMEVVATYNNGEDLLEGCKQRQPDVLLLDIQMPGMQGDVVCKNITRLYPGIRVMALTNLDNVFYIRSMFKAGALGYVLKTAPESTILQGILAVYNNQQFLEKELQQVVVQSSLLGKTRETKTIITEREKEVLVLIAENNTSKEIAEKLFLSKRTIDHHRNNLLLKLDVKNTAALIKKAISMDLLE